MKKLTLMPIMFCFLNNAMINSANINGKTPFKKSNGSDEVINKAPNNVLAYNQAESFLLTESDREKMESSTKKITTTDSEEFTFFQLISLRKK